MQFITTFHEAELNAAALMRSWGFSDAVATTGGADGGIDVSARGALAQVKWKNGSAGRPDLQRLYGARGTSSNKALFFFAASSYTKGAIEYADSVGMSLLIYDPTGQALPANDVARKFLEQVGVTSPAPIQLNIDDYVIRAGLLVGVILAGFGLWLTLSASP